MINPTITEHEKRIFESFGKTIHSALIFCEFADEIKHETGIDVYERKATLQADAQVIERLIKKWRREKTFVDESILDAAWREFLRDLNILTKEEQHTKDEYSLVKARATKDELRRAGISDVARFGYCSKNNCKDRTVERLLVRGFCPQCRGITVQQTIAAGASVSQLMVSVNLNKIHPNVLKLTSEERQARVLEAKNNNPGATERELARLTGIPRSTVKDILRRPIVKTKPEQSCEVQKFLRERAKGCSSLCKQPSKN